MLPTPPNQVYYRGPFTLYSSAETCGLPTHHPLPTSTPPHPAMTRGSLSSTLALRSADDCSFACREWCSNCAMAGRVHGRVWRESLRSLLGGRVNTLTPLLSA